MNRQEEWRPVAGFEGYYEVSNLGRIKSLQRRHVPTDRILRPAVDRYGYLYVFMSPGEKALRRRVYAHRAVATAFLDPSPDPDAVEVCHNDGDPANNHISNLRWGTHADNMTDTVAHGRHWNAVKTHCPAGHAYTPDNTEVSTSRGCVNRRCRTCIRERRASRKSVAA